MSEPQTQQNETTPEIEATACDFPSPPEGEGPGMRGPAGDTVEDRLMIIGDWLTEGMPRTQAVQLAEQRLHVSRRTAQSYVQNAMLRLAREGAEEHRLYQLRVSQLQRERLIAKALAAVERLTGLVEPPDAKLLANLLGVASKLMDGRDRVATELHKMLGHREQTTTSRETEVAWIRAQADLLNARTKAMAKGTDPTPLSVPKPADRQQPRARPEGRPTLDPVERALFAPDARPDLPSVTRQEPKAKREQGMQPSSR